MANQTVNEGDKALFICQTTGSPIPNIIWYFNGFPLVSENSTKYMISEMSINSTVKSSTLTVIDVALTDIGIYLCNATNTESSNTSSGMLAINGEFISH